jgi:hypothetical protein
MHLLDSRGLCYVHYRSADRVGLTCKPTATVVYSVRVRRIDAAGGMGGAKSESEDEYESYLPKKFSCYRNKKFSRFRISKILSLTKLTVVSL